MKRRKSQAPGRSKSLRGSTGYRDEPLTSLLSPATQEPSLKVMRTIVFSLRGTKEKPDPFLDWNTMEGQTAEAQSLPVGEGAELLTPSAQQRGGAPCVIYREEHPRLASLDCSEQDLLLLGYFSFCCVKIPGKNNLRKDLFCLTV